MLVRGYHEICDTNALFAFNFESFPDFAVVQRFDVLRSDGDRVVLTDKLLRQIREIRSKDESSSDDSNSEDSSDGSDNG